MKKILLISHWFPPLNSPASLRTYSWAKYWSKGNAEVYVLTTKKRPINGLLDLEIEADVAKRIHVEELPYWPFQKEDTKIWGNRSATNPVIDRFKTYLKKIRKQHTGLLLDSRMFWIQPALRFAEALYKDWQYDIIVSSFSPPAPHIIAGNLKRKFGVPWIADYRDLWTDNHFFHPTWFFSEIEKGVENSLLKRADMITTVSDPLRDQLYTRFGHKTITIENGFDEDELPGPRVDNYFQKDNKIHLVYTGTIYDQYNIDLLFEAVSVLLSKNKSYANSLSVNFYCFEFLELQKKIKAFGLENSIQTNGFVDHKTTLQIQRSADALLFFEWNDPEVDGVLTSKLFEYITAGKPILSIGKSKNDIGGKLIEDCGTGVILGNSLEKTIQVLDLLLLKREIPYSPNPEKIRKYSRRLLANRMLEEFDHLGNPQITA